jgi:hypothetical protein
MSHEIDTQSPKITLPELRREEPATTNEEIKPSKGGNRTGLFVAFGMLALLALLVVLNMG